MTSAASDTSASSGSATGRSSWTKRRCGGGPGSCRGGVEADGFVGVFQVETVAAAAVVEGVGREEAVREDVVQDDVAEAAGAVVEGGGVREWGVDAECFRART